MADRPEGRSGLERLGESAAMSRDRLVQGVGKLGECTRRHAQRERSKVHLEHAAAACVDRCQGSLRQARARAVRRFRWILVLVVHVRSDTRLPSRGWCRGSGRFGLRPLLVALRCSLGQLVARPPPALSVGTVTVRLQRRHLSSIRSST